MSLPKEGTHNNFVLTHGWKYTNHHQKIHDKSLGDPLKETPIVEDSIWDPINAPLEEKLHNHWVVDDKPNKYLNDPIYDSYFNHVTMKEEEGKNNQTSLEGKVC